MELGELMVFSVISTQTGTNRQTCKARGGGGDGAPLGIFYNRMKLSELMVFSVVSNKLGQIVNV